MSVKSLFKRMTGLYKLDECRSRLQDLSGRFLITEAGRREYDLRYQDLLLLLERTARFIPEEPFSLQTNHPVASESNDHKRPWGSKNDNTRSPRFVLACERHFPRAQLDYLDLGCSGGGLILDFLLRGHRAIGLEGSDYSLKAQRAEWRLLGNRCLFTADITKPFQIFPPTNSGEGFTAHVVSAWEVMEHIGEEDLPALFENVKRHLRPDGYFIGSISLFEDVVDGVSYHPTVKPRGWWSDKFKEFGLPFTDRHDFEFGDFCRGTGNGYFDGDYSRDPELGFHFVARKA
jgi:SAM-dependent methyltransferase